MTSRSRMRIWRKRLTRAILCFLLGAVTTVGVAWIFVIAPRSAKGRVRLEGAGQYWGVFWFRNSGAGLIDVRTSQRPADEQPRFRFRRDEADDRRFDDALDATVAAMPFDDLAETPLMRQLGFHRGRIPSEPTDRGYRERFAGWPFTCLYSRRVFVVPASGAPQEIASPASPVRIRGEMLPARPIFPGFLLDTLFYAAPWWLILGTPGALKRCRRRRRGRCVGCGYDLAGLRADDNATPTCPECGA